MAGSHVTPRPPPLSGPLALSLRFDTDLSSAAQRYLLLLLHTAPFLRITTNSSHPCASRGWAILPVKRLDSYFFLEPVAELTIASTKNPFGLMASLRVRTGFMASHAAVSPLLNDLPAIAP